MLPIFRSKSAMRAETAAWRAQGWRIALVPTMGALHDGHLALVKQALTRADRAIVSIFVNPTQFGPQEDFATYPRQEAADVAKLADAGAHAVYMPLVDTVYPRGFATQVTVSGVSDGLCGAVRPGHFAGVATVVTKLLLQVAPDIALFGEKDYQQLQVIRRLVADLDIDVVIEGVPTLREADGLAMSSRNAYLTAADRAVAPALHQSLQRAAARLRGGDEVEPVVAEAMAAILAAGFASVDYVELRAAEGLAPLAQLDRPARLLAAAHLGKTRLIDNVAVTPL